jgi:hypothetical protein
MVFLLFLLHDRRIQIRIRILPVTNGFGSGMPETYTPGSGILVYFYSCFFCLDPIQQQSRHFKNLKGLWHERLDSFTFVNQNSARRLLGEFGFFFLHSHFLFRVIFKTDVRHVTGNDQDYLGESPERLFRYLRFSKRATVGVRATYATR